jgi:hypothetical protein
MMLNKMRMLNQKQLFSMSASISGTVLDGLMDALLNITQTICV